MAGGAGAAAAFDIERLIPAVIEAGRLTLVERDRGLDAQYKSDDSPVTAADHAAEAVLLAALARHAPGIPVVAEEECAAGRIPDVDQEFFLVDPLDGTKEFIKGGSDFTVNVALVENRAPVTRRGLCLGSRKQRSGGATSAADGRSASEVARQ